MSAPVSLHAPYRPDASQFSTGCSCTYYYGRSRLFLFYFLLYFFIAMQRWLWEKWTKKNSTCELSAKSHGIGIDAKRLAGLLMFNQILNRFYRSIIKTIHIDDGFSY